MSFHGDRCEDTFGKNILMIHLNQVNEKEFGNLSKIRLKETSSTMIEFHNLLKVRDVHKIGKHQGDVVDVGLSLFMDSISLKL
eukprot:snap_masked-scaffold_14-processed-gene-5.36-mRNA-1 protein AED:1.00 eAED:1.00 QI:0/0/0/0/1/1/2/0/82